VDLEPLHPLPSQFPYYLQVFKQRVDPLVKVLHIPTVEKIFIEVQKSLGQISKETEALMFSIYFAVATRYHLLFRTTKTISIFLTILRSMSTAEVKLDLGIEKDVIRDRYKFGAEQALTRASFLDSSKLIVLQSLIIYLSCICSQEEGRAGWALTRLAIGIAEWLGLHRDGSNFNLPCFESEMRRRIWWQLCSLDSRNSERFRTYKTIRVGSFDTRLPRNINDSDLRVDAEVLPQARQGMTDMTLALLAAKIFSVVNKLQGSTCEGRMDGKSTPL
jgi:hypothetical protein